MNVLCPQCKQESSLFFQTKDLNQKISCEIFDYYICPKCRLIFLFPVPSDIGIYYRGNYPAYAIPTSIKDLIAKSEKVRFRIEIVQKFVTQGCLLEIGPSYGGFAFLAKQAGFEVKVIEMDKQCCQFLTDVVGVYSINTDNVIMALWEAPRYNVIALWHVIEHLSEPWTILNMLAKLLLPGGIIVISTPNPDSLQFKILKRYWVNVDAPRHLELIPATLLKRFMHERGLETVLITTTDKDGLTLNRFGWNVSLMHLFNNPIGKLSMRVMWRIISFVLNPIERNGLHGSAYTMVFRKN